MAAKKEIKIESFEGDIILKAVERDDIKLLRKWKNENRKYFFYNKIIKAKQQSEWFQSYISTADDYIFLIEYKGLKIGCIGFRLAGEVIDVYNVILGEKKFGGRGIMGRALRLMCSYIKDIYNKEITLKVLSENKARLWYSRNGFVEAGREGDEYTFMKLDINKFEYLKYNLEIN